MLILSQQSRDWATLLQWENKVQMALPKRRKSMHRRKTIIPIPQRNNPHIRTYLDLQNLGQVKTAIPKRKVNNSNLAELQKRLSHYKIKKWRGLPYHRLLRRVHRFTKWLKKREYIRIGGKITKKLKVFKYMLKKKIYNRHQQRLVRRAQRIYKQDPKQTIHKAKQYWKVYSMKRKKRYFFNFITRTALQAGYKVCESDLFTRKTYINKDHYTRLYKRMLEFTDPGSLTTSPAAIVSHPNAKKIYTTNKIIIKRACVYNTLRFMVETNLIHYKHSDYKLPNLWVQVIELLDILIMIDRGGLTSNHGYHLSKRSIPSINKQTPRYIQLTKTNLKSIVDPLLCKNQGDIIKKSSGTAGPYNKTKFLKIRTQDYQIHEVRIKGPSPTLRTKLVSMYKA